jgi:hypothetical protein
VKTVIEMARESRLDVYGLGKDHEKFVAALERFAGQVLINDALEKKAKNAKEMGLDYDPA